MPSSRLMRGTALAATLVFGLGAAGCGSSKSKSNKTSTSTPAITKAAFLKQGNAICKRGNQQIAKAANTLFPRTGPKPSKARMTKFATSTVVPSLQSQINQIKALGTPAGDQTKVNAIVSSAQSALDKGKKDPALLTSNGSSPFKKTNQLSRSYGLKTCAAG